jgi:hypothetical protein
MKPGETYVLKESLKSNGKEWLVYCKLKKYLGNDMWWVDWWYWNNVDGMFDLMDPKEVSGESIHKELKKVEHADRRNL